MNESPGIPEWSELDDAQQMQRWVRRYAQNRSLPVVVNLIAFTILFLAIALPSYWGGNAYRNGNSMLLAICLGMLTIALAATIYLSVPRWGGQRLQRMAEGL